MPRLARNELEGKTLFHVMVQGINKEKIFEGEREKLDYIKLMNQHKEEFHVKIIAYCVMSNHVHLLINTEKIENLTHYMHIVNTSYGIYYNKNKKRVGYVYRDRFKTQVINDERHLYNCIIYIHNNPVKAGICKDTSQYKFSSYKSFFDKQKQDILIRIFENRSKYIKANEIENVIDMDFLEDEADNEKNIENTIVEYFLKNKTNYIEIKIYDEKLKELDTKLKKSYKMTNIRLSRYLKVSKYKIDKILNEQK